MNPRPFVVGLCLALVALCPALHASGHVDMLVFGNEASEVNHALTPIHSEKVASGALGESARRLLAPSTEGWEGGRVTFRLKVDPTLPNYFTARFWGSDTHPNRLILFCEGKQIGYRHLGDIDLLDIGNKDGGYNGRFFYNTSPLPLELTRGKTEVTFQIRSTGPIWGYGGTFETYQKPMTEPTRGLYRVYTHTDGAFTPPDEEKQGEYPAKPPVRSSPGPEILEKVKERVNRETSSILAAKNTPSQQEAQFLAKAWHVAWTPAHKNPAVVDRVIAAGDAYYRAWVQNPKLAKADPKQYNADWFGVGPLANAIRLLPEQLAPSFAETIDDGTGKRITRRQAWGDLLSASRDALRNTRPHYTNQTMIQDMNIYLTNRGLSVVDRARAMSEAEVRRYLYEAIGIQPWLGSDTAKGPAKPFGERFYQLTDKGLTKELGYVGNYGEILDWVTHIYLATAEPGRPETGDVKIRAQLSKLEHARAVFRYPMLDGEGNRAMRLETIIGWRDSYYPGDVTYAERSAWEGSAIYSVAATLDQRSVGAVQQMFADNQFFHSVEGLLKQGGLRVTNTLLAIPDDYARIAALPPSPHRLPMTWSEPDFAWTDEENGVVALKRGNEILYASLYWRSRYAVNGLARIHHLTPLYDRIAVVRQDTVIDDSGLVYKRPETVNMGFGNGGLRYPGDWKSAHAGETLPIARVPEEVKFKPGEENTYAGKAQFYKLRYGDYLIGLNTTTDRTFDLAVPEGAAQAPELVSGKVVALNGALKVGPRSTVILYLGK